MDGSSRSDLDGNSKLAEIEAAIAEGGRSELKEDALAALEETASAAEAFMQLHAWSLKNERAQSAEAFELESALWAGSNEVFRRLLDESMAARGSGDIGRALVLSEEATVETAAPDGGNEVLLSNRREHQRNYQSVFGTVQVHRVGYGAPGHSSVHPLDEQLNLPHRSYSYVLQRRATKLASRGPFDEAVDELRETTARGIPKRQLEEIVEEAARDFDAFYEEQVDRLLLPDETGSLMVAGIDCKGVPRRKTAEERAVPKPKHLNKGQKRQRKKMATVATVHTTAPHMRTPEQVTAALMDPGAPAAGGPKPKAEARRLWASVRKSKDQVMSEVASEMSRRDPYGEKTVVALTDGERALQNRVVSHLKFAFCNLILVLDILHVLSYLWKAAHAFEEEGSEEARLWVRERLRKILEGKVTSVIAGMKQSATKRKLSKSDRKPVDDACKYFRNNKDRMRYDEYLGLGLPIASGTAEGACGHLVKDRMEPTGASWDVTAPRVDAVLKLRALDKSGDFDAYWEFHMRKEKERLYPEKWRRAA